MRKIFAGEWWRFRSFDQWKVLTSNDVIFWGTDIIQEKWRRWDFQYGFSQADVRDILYIFLAIDGLNTANSGRHRSQRHCE